MAKGILYVMKTVVNGLIKIGKTTTDNFESRMYNLEHNGYANVVGLKREFAIEVEDYSEKEAMLDTIFSKSQVPGTELFAMDISIVIQLLSSFEGKVIYPITETKKDIFDEAVEESEKATPAKTPSGKAKRFKFSMVNIPVGAELTYVGDHVTKVTVADDSHVFYNNERWSLSALAQKLGNRPSSTQGTLWFEYNGEKLTDLRKKAEGGKKQ